MSNRFLQTQKSQSSNQLRPQKDGGEFPDPLTACSGYRAPTGLPITIQVGGNVTTSVSAHAFTGNGSPLAHCVIDSNNPSLGSNLKSRGAVILVPQQPLHAGTNYTVALTVNGVPYTWSFGVTSDYSITSAQACPVTLGALVATESTTQFSVSASVSNCTASSIAFEQFDVTINEGWFSVGGVAPVAGTSTQVANGYRGHTYQFRARALSGGGLVGPWSVVGSTQVSPTATLSHPYSGMYTLDGFGGVDADSSPPLAGSAYWLGWKIARAAHAQPGSSAPQSGFVLDGYGGLHSYGAPITAAGNPYWGWDIGRDFAFLPDGTGGYVLDGYGGLQPFGVNGHAAPAAATGSPYWGWDVARKVVIFSDGTGGYVLDAYGGLHPFAIGGGAKPGGAVGATYWGWNIARDVVLIPGTHAGYVLDDYEGPDGATSKLFSVTSPSGARSDYPHPLAGDELMNNSFATISPDGQWFVSGEWLQLQRLLVFAMPQLNPSAPAPGQALPLAATIQLDHPVRDVQGCDFASATRLLCAADDAGTDLWPTPKQLLQVDLARPLDGQAVTAHVTSLGELPMQSLCSGSFEVEGIDVAGSQLLVEVTPPGVCGYAVTTIYRYILT